MNIAENKKSLRREAEELRHCLTGSVPNTADAIADNFFGAFSLASSAIVAGYVAARGEAEPLPLLERLRTAGCLLALTRVVEKGQPLHFHLWRDDVAPVKSAYGMMEAPAGWPSVIPTILLIPLLGFDKEGYRLGYGGGFYDRTLCSLRAHTSVLAIGIAFSGQEMVLPHDEYDERLDWIVTEKTAQKFDSKTARETERD